MADTKVECDICGKEFAKLWAMKTHKIWHNPNSPKAKSIRKKLGIPSKNWHKLHPEHKPMLGKKMSKESRMNYTLSKLGSKNPMWKGDKVSYIGLHVWVKYRKPKPQFCVRCNNPPYDLANISGQYKRDVNDFEWLCRRCHMIKDGRINHMSEIGKLGRLSQLRSKNG